MTPRRKRLWSVALMVCGVAAATAFALQAFQKNLLYFYNPTQVRSGSPTSQYRVGIGRPSAVRGSLRMTAGSPAAVRTHTSKAASGARPKRAMRTAASSAPADTAAV